MIKCITGSDDNMGKIEIHDLEEILKQNYPPKVVESLISQVLIRYKKYYYCSYKR